MLHLHERAGVPFRTLAAVIFVLALVLLVGSNARSILEAHATVSLIPTSQTHEVFGTYFLAGKGYSSRIVIRNQRMDQSVTVTPGLWVDDGREISLNSVTLPAHGLAYVDVNQALEQQHEKNVQAGAVVLRYQFPTAGAINASTEIANEKSGIYLSSAILGRMEFMSRTLEAVFWFPREEAGGFVALVNTSLQWRHATGTVFLGNQSHKISEINLGPREAKFVELSSLTPARKRQSIVGIRLVSDGEPGDIMAEGAVTDRVTGYAKRINFSDTSLHFFDSTLRTGFLLLGQPPSEFGFKAGVSYRAVAAVRNTSGDTIRIMPTIKVAAGRTLREVRMPQVTLGGNSSAIIDFTRAQLEDLIPQNFHIGMLELVPDHNTSAVIAELSNYDEAGGNVVGPSFTSKPSRGSGAYWRIDGDWQTLITFSNAATADDDVFINLFYEGGSYRLGPVRIAPGSVSIVNLKQLYTGSIRDADGNLLPATLGTFSIAGSHGGRSGIVMERLVYSSRLSDYNGAQSSSNYVTGCTGDATGATGQTFDVIMHCNWNDGSTTQETPNQVSTLSRSTG